jgi:hypothetical protein
MKPKLLIAFLVTASMTQYALASCKRPDEPTLPNVDNAVLAEMVKASKDVKKYIADANKYLECSRSDSDHDKVVSRMRELADSFNALTTTFKARQKTTEVAAN